MASTNVKSKGFFWTRITPINADRSVSEAKWDRQDSANQRAGIAEKLGARSMNYSLQSALIRVLCYTSA